MADYIEREALLKAMSYHNYYPKGKHFLKGIETAEEIIEHFPVADVVSKAAYDQVAWERHLTEVQLKSIGKSIGEKMDDVQPVKHGRWVELDYDKSFCKCSECGVNWEWNIIFDCNFNYCPSCGAIMDGGDF